LSTVGCLHCVLVRQAHKFPVRGTLTHNCDLLPTERVPNQQGCHNVTYDRQTGVLRLCTAVVLPHRFDFGSWDVIEHSHSPVDWNLPPEQQQHPLAAKEPRRGRRLSLAADVLTPQGPLRVYCCHLEVRPAVFCADVVSNSRQVV
jgi:hypothetical protein